MSKKHKIVAGIVAAVCGVSGVVTAVSAGPGRGTGSPTLAQQVRSATSSFRDLGQATDAGYASLGSCLSGPQEGAMGVHFGRSELIGDGQVNADAPELLIYEQRNGRMRLVGVEFLVLAADWDAAHTDGAPPVLAGQHFQFVGSPNRYRLPAFYELHVWAWKDNRSGTFADWNPAVSCDEYVGEAGADHAAHGG